MTAVYQHNIITILYCYHDATGLCYQESPSVRVLKFQASMILSSVIKSSLTSNSGLSLVAEQSNDLQKVTLKIYSEDSDFLMKS